MPIIIPGTPIAKKRPRFARRGNYVVTYNSQETEEGRFFLEARSQWQEPIFGGGVEIEVVYEMPIPKGTSRKKVEKMLSGEIRHLKKPDTDNLVKFTKDCLTNIVWKDDAQVWKETVEKRFSLEPKTIIFIKKDHVMREDREEEKE